MDQLPASWRPHPYVQRAAVYSLCLVAVAAGAWVVLEVLGQLSIVLFPVLIALFLARVLSIPGHWLTRHGWPPAAAAATVLFGFIALLTGLGFALAPPIAREFQDLGPTLEDASAEVEDWLVEDTSLDITHKDVQDFKDDVGQRGEDAFKDSTQNVARGARLVVELIVGLVLALILTFFAVKDGPAFQRWAIGWVPERRRHATRLVAASAWTTLGGYLRGAALLGILEGTIIGITLAAVGASLVVPVMVLTFVAAFIPLVGAVVAGVIAVLVAFATGGLGDAAVVAVVALLVQQFDNELLAPLIYGRALSLHPVVILLSLAAGTALFGFAGTALAVPLVAVVINGVAALRREGDGAPGDHPGDDGGPPGASDTAVAPA